jgi:uncharacterized protein (TIGR03435 family)
MVYRALIVLAAAGIAWGQSFEVASVKASPETARSLQIRGGPGTSDPGTVMLSGINLQSLMTMAYGVNSYQIAGPGWLTAARFDINAKLPPDTTVDQYRAMLRDLLAKRFALVAHRGQREGQTFDLVVAKNGPILKTSAANSKGADDGSLQPAFGPPSPPPGYNGRLALAVRNASMEQFAARLSGLIGQPVRDATGLTSKYDIQLAYTLAGLQVDAPSATIFDALQEQLGLKLTRKKGMIELLTIDHIEKVPTGN